MADPGYAPLPADLCYHPSVVLPSLPSGVGEGILGKSCSVVGDNTGRVNTTGLPGGQLSVTGDQLRVGYGLVWAAVGRFTGNPNNEIAPRYGIQKRQS